MLGQFLQPPFVQGNPPSDRRIPLHLMLYKTTFLLALAAGARRSELHALVRTPPGFRVARDPATRAKSLHLRPFEGFVAKNQMPDTVFQPFIIPAMEHLVPHEPERLLCPVRAVRQYIDRTSSPEFLKGRSRLLLHHNTSVEATRSSHISQWIVDAIVTAYRHTQDDNRRIHRVTAHEVRAVAQSVAYFNNASLSEVMEGARWRSRSTFVGHYLRDVQQDLEGLFRLGPVVVAQRVIRPPQ